MFTFFDLRRQVYSLLNADIVMAEVAEMEAVGISNLPNQRYVRGSGVIEKINAFKPFFVRVY